MPNINIEICEILALEIILYFVILTMFHENSAGLSVRCEQEANEWQDYR